MYYCQKCGTQLEDGDLFCPNCGSKRDQQVQDAPTPQNYEQVPNYQQAPGYQQTPNYQQAPAYQQVPNYQQLNNLKQSIKPEVLFKTLGDMLMKPVTTAKKFVRESEKNDTIVITVFLLIVQGILGIWKASQIIGNIQDLMEGLTNGLAAAFANIISGSSLGLSSGMFSELSKYKSAIKIPYAKIFFQNCAIFIIGVAVLFAIVYLGIVISKKKADLFALYKTVLIASVPVLYFELFSIVLSYASLWLGICILLAGWMISAGCLAAVTEETFMTDENCSLFFAAAASVISFIIIALAMKNFISSDVTSIIKSFESSLNSIL